MARARATLTAAEARRVGLAAQGIGQAQPAQVTTRHLTATITRLHLLQLDTVNVFERAHYLPLFARLGTYDRSALDRLVRHDLASRPRVRSVGAFTEAWAHEAAIIPVADMPLLRHRQRAFRARNADWFDANAGVCAAVLDEVRAEGPRSVPQIDHPENVRLPGGWWNKNIVHQATNMLFLAGELTVIGRRRFERVYDVRERALGDDDAVETTEARQELVRRAAVSLGVATIDDLRDYYRLPTLADARVAVDALVAAGELQPVDVEGWQKPAFLHVGARIPRRVDAAALLSPFDPVVWHRPRALRMWGFHYRIAIYTPAALREHGYYVLPVLLDDDLVGRVDLKSDRKARVLRVQHAHIEPHATHRADEAAARIAPVLAAAAAWQGLEDVSVTGPGTWAGAVRTALASERREPAVSATETLR